MILINLKMNKNQESEVPEAYSSIKSLFKEYGMVCNDDICSIILEPIYKITSDILSEAKSLSFFANHTEISEADIEIATKRVMSNIEFNTHTNLEVVKESSESINLKPLPEVKCCTGLKFPNDRNNLTAPNFEVKTPSELSAPIPLSHKYSFMQAIIARNGSLLP